MARTRKNINGQSVVVVEPDFRAAPINVPQEVWDELFPGRNKFREQYGNIVRGKITKDYEEYEYIDKNDGSIKTVRFTKQAP